MITYTRLSTLLVVFFALVVGVVQAARPDSGHWPQILVPSTTTIAAGQSGGFSLSMTQSGSTATTVYLSSSDTSVLQVPASITIPAGNVGAYFTATTSPLPSAKIAKKGLAGVTIKVTATANGRSAETNVTVQ